jgi:hypothetical protein
LIEEYGFLSGRSCTNVLNGTARIGSAAQTEFVSKEENPGSLSNVQSGDVLVSHPTAVREHEISIVPNAPHAISPTHDAAVSDGRSEADAIGVDAWLTEDQTHVVKIASNRTPAEEERRGCPATDGAT